MTVRIASFRLRALAPLALCALLAGACKPKSIEDAEKKGDVAWLEANATPAAVEALGRLADKDPTALAAIESHAARKDVGAYIAAWNAHLRDAPWGGAMLRKGLTEPGGAELAAAAMARKDPHLVEFIPDLEAAMTRLGSSSRASVVSGALASIGVPAVAAVERRLMDGASRGSMCRGMTSEEAGPEVRAVLFKVPPGARDDMSCIATVVALAAADEKVFMWLAKEGEAGLLSAASKAGGLPCGPLAKMWATVFAERPATIYPSLPVPLSEVLKRCPKEIDATLADVMKTVPAARAAVIAAVDPYGGALAIMSRTCTQLNLAGGSKLPPMQRQRAADAYRHGCLSGR